MIFLIEANEKYIDELQKFKEEVLQADKDNDDQFADRLLFVKPLIEVF